MKPIRLTRHARQQSVERGATEAEVRHAIQHGSREPVKAGRMLCRFAFPYDQLWQGKRYAIKQVVPVIAEGAAEIVVIKDAVKLRRSGRRYKALAAQQP